MNQMATILKHGNTYRIRVSCGYDLSGAQIMKSVTWRPDPDKTQRQNEKALEQEAVLFEKKVKDGLYLDGSIKLAEFIEQWLKDYAAQQLAPKTLFRYKELLERILPALGHLHMDKLQPHHLVAFYSSLQESGIRGDMKYKPTDRFLALLKETGLTNIKIAEKADVSPSVLTSCSAGKNISKKSAELLTNYFERKFNTLFKPATAPKSLSNKTVLYYHRLLSSILTTAVQWQVILSNPAARVKPPKVEYKEAKYLDDEQAKHVLDLLTLEPIKYRTGIALLIYSGLRRGELCGLRWSDIDFANKTVSITKSTQYLPGKGIFDKEPKNKSSVRVIKLPADIFILLRDYRAWQLEERLKLADRWIDDDRLFTAWNGAPMHPDTLSDWFHDFVKKNDLPDISIHSLRHTNATLLISGGVPLRVVADMLGHAQPTTTANIYTHSIKSATAAAADTLGDILSPAKGRKRA